MVCGVYSLIFSGTDKVYIGKSTNITNRFKVHMYKLTKGIHTKKLNDAYTTYGTPSLRIIKECSVQDLLLEEKDTIKQYDSINNGFNFLGTKSVNKDCSEDEIIEAFLLLVDASNVSTRGISNILNIPITIVDSISKCKDYLWLKEDYPKLYKILENMNTSRERKCIDRSSFPFLVSPEGKVYKVNNLAEFAITHSLDKGNLNKVLLGYSKSIKGWKALEENIYE